MWIFVLVVGDVVFFVVVEFGFFFVVLFILVVVVGGFFVFVVGCGVFFFVVFVVVDVFVGVFFVFVVLIFVVICLFGFVGVLVVVVIV